LEHSSDAHTVVCSLIQEQRRLATSPYISERFRTLWTAAMVDKRLKQCTDREVGDLMRFVQERFGLFEAEFAICHHARRRLLLKSAKERPT
jgi:hypothetical protein